MTIGISSSKLENKENITSIFKKNKKEDLGSYRLISFTLIIGKVMKKSSWKAFPKTWRTRRWSGVVNIDLQRGNHVWPTLLSLTETTSFVDDGRTVRVVYLTNTVRFNSASAKWGRLRTGQMSGHRGVVISGTKSIWSQVSNGVLCHLILGSILFNTFINDLDYGMGCIPHQVCKPYKIGRSRW